MMTRVEAQLESWRRYELLRLSGVSTCPHFKHAQTYGIPEEIAPAEPSHVADLVSYLAKPETSYVTGKCYVRVLPIYNAYGSRLQQLM